MRDEQRKEKKGMRIVMGNARIGEVSGTVREECQRVMV